MSRGRWMSLQMIVYFDQLWTVQWSSSSKVRNGDSSLDIELSIRNSKQMVKVKSSKMQRGTALEVRTLTVAGLQLKRRWTIWINPDCGAVHMSFGRSSELEFLAAATTNSELTLGEQPGALESDAYWS